MFFDRIRPLPLPRALAILIISVALLSLLFLPVQLPDQNRLGLIPRPELEVMVLLGLLAVLVMAGRSLGFAWRLCIGALVTLGAAVNLASAVVPSFFERELDLYLDLRHVPNLIGLFLDATGRVRGWAIVLGLSLAILLLPVLIAWLIGAMERALRGGARASIALGAALIGVILALVPIGEEPPLIAPRMTAELAHHASVAWRSFRIMNGAPGPYGVALNAPPPPASDLGKLKQGNDTYRDVYLVFFESYGTTVLDDPGFAKALSPALASFESKVRDAGYYLVSNRVDSPTFGGGSWLAHGTIDSGLKLDGLLYQLIQTTERPTLADYMRRVGYRTLEIMPGLKHASETEAKFWGFDRTVSARDLHYDGPEFGWFEIPDQWTLKVALRDLNEKPHPPVFTQIVLVSSHTPFAPVPPYLEDWANVGPYDGISKARWDQIYTDPDWWHLEQPYIDSVKYDLETLAGWLAQLKGQPLIIILGDHQPPGFLSGRVAPHTVPIHILSRDDELVLPFTKLGYVAGAIPPEKGDFKGMETFLPDFLRLLASDRSLAELR